MSINYLKAAIVALFLSLSSLANASLIYDIEVEFESGGSFLGQIEFSDPTRVTAITGMASGGDRNYNEAINWVWSIGTSQPAYFDGEWYYDWFMNNTPTDWNSYFGLAWKVDGSSVLFSQAPYQDSQTYDGGIFNDDNIVSVSVLTQVPEPSTLAIVALGMLGFASRKFSKK